MIETHNQSTTCQQQHKWLQLGLTYFVAADWRAALGALRRAGNLPIAHAHAVAAALHLNSTDSEGTARGHINALQAMAAGATLEGAEYYLLPLVHAQFGSKRLAKKSFKSALQQAPEAAHAFEALRVALKVKAKANMNASHRTAAAGNINLNTALSSIWDNLGANLGALQSLKPSMPRAAWVAGAGLLGAGAMGTVAAVMPEFGSAPMYQQAFNGGSNAGGGISSVRARATAAQPVQAAVPTYAAPQQASAAQLPQYSSVATRAPAAPATTRVGGPIASPEATGRGQSQQFQFSQPNQPSAQQSTALFTEDTEVVADRTKGNKNIRLGPVAMDLSLNTGIEFDDNVTASANQSESDIILTTGLKMDSVLQFNKHAALRFGLGLQYKKYIDNSQLDSGSNFLDLSDGTGIEVDFRVGELDFTVYDRLRFSMDATDARRPSGPTSFNFEVDRFGRFENSFGILTTYQRRRSQITVGIERNDVLPQQASFAFARSIEYRVPVSFNYALAADKEAGLSAEYATRDYPDESSGFRNNDGQSVSIGPNFKWDITQRWTLNTAVKFKRFFSDGNGTTGDTSERDDVTANFGLNHQLTKRFQHGLSYQRSVNFGLSTNTVRTDLLGYNFNWKAFKNASINGGVAYETADESGPRGDQYDRFDIRLGTQYQLTRKLSTSIDYIFTTKDSDIVESGYDRNRLMFRFNYDF